MNHAERYESLITKLSSMRWRGGELDVLICNLNLEPTAGIGN